MDSLRRLIDATSRCLCRYENLVAGRPVLAAISGGADSTALAYVLERLRAEDRLPGPLAFCHVDHGVRSDSADNAAHVAELARRLDVPLHLRRLEASPQAASEDRLRTGRYRLLGEVASAIGAGSVVTAHHADDNLETVLFRLLRGTGPRGLAGIPEARWLVSDDGRRLVVRPFLKVRRNTLAGLLHRIGIAPYQDSSNLDRRYTRNRLRLETIPRLQQELGIGLDVALMTVASTARAATEILDAQARRILAECTTRRAAHVRRLDLGAAMLADRTFVREALRMLHVDLHAQGAAPLEAWLDRAMSLLDKPAGTRLQGRSGLLVERTRTGLLVADPGRIGAPPTPTAPEALAWDKGRVRFGQTEWLVQAIEHPHPPLSPSPSEAGPFRALLDPLSAPLPWRLRTRRPGDRFAPHGSDQTVELRRFMQSRGIPRFDRDRMPILVDAQDRILWAPGCDIADFARIRLNTRRTLEVRVTAG